MGITRIQIMLLYLGVGSIILCLCLFLHMQLIFFNPWMWYAFSLLSIITGKLSINFFDLVYTTSIDWTLLQPSMTCVQRPLSDLPFSQPLQRLVLFHTILKRCLVHYVKDRSDQNLHHPPHLRLPLHIPRVSGLHLKMFQSYASSPLIYIQSEVIRRLLQHFSVISIAW